MPVVGNEPLFIEAVVVRAVGGKGSKVDFIRSKFEGIFYVKNFRLTGIVRCIPTGCF